MTAGAAVGLEIVVLGDSITVKEITGICILQSAATTGVEQRTVVPAQFCHHITWLPNWGIVIGEKSASRAEQPCYLGETAFFDAYFSFCKYRIQVTRFRLRIYVGVIHKKVR